MLHRLYFTQKCFVAHFTTATAHVFTCTYNYTPSPVNRTQKPSETKKTVDARQLCNPNKQKLRLYPTRFTYRSSRSCGSRTCSASQTSLVVKKNWIFSKITGKWLGSSRLATRNIFFNDFDFDNSWHWQLLSIPIAEWWQ